MKTWFNQLNSIWRDPARVEQLHRLFDTGITMRAIGAAMGLTKNAVIGKLNRSGMCRSRVSHTAQRDYFGEIGRNGCMFGLGHLGEAKFRFCGVERHPGRPYCPAHCAVAYRPEKLRRDGSEIDGGEAVLGETEFLVLSRGLSK